MWQLIVVLTGKDGWLVEWCLTPLSTILQLYRGSQFYIDCKGEKMHMWIFMRFSHVVYRLEGEFFSFFFRKKTSISNFEKLLITAAPRENH
jgi:hypothetical protein